MTRKLTIIASFVIAALVLAIDISGQRKKDTTGHPATQQLAALVAEVGPVQPLKQRPGLRQVSAGQTDLFPAFLGFTERGRVRYRLENIGDVAAAQPFVVDVYVNGQRKDTVKHNPLPGLSQQEVRSNLARAESCGPTTLRLVVDSQRVVPESDENNNSSVRQDVVPPCPDLVVSIHNDEQGTLKYRAKVKVTNKGNLDVTRNFFVLLKGSGQNLSFAALPVMKRQRIEGLAAGESTSFYEGKDHLKTSTFHYYAIADQLEEITESNEGNNGDGRTLGPH